LYIPTHEIQWVWPEGRGGQSKHPLLKRGLIIFVLGTKVPRHSAGGLYICMYACPQEHTSEDVHVWT